MSDEPRHQSLGVPLARAIPSACAATGETIHPLNEKGATPRKDDAPFLTRNDTPVSREAAYPFLAVRASRSQDV